MLKFQVFDNGRPAEGWSIRNPYLLGSDNSAMRASISFEDGLLIVEKREPGAAALGLQVSAGDCGELTLQTCLLPERDEPYILHLELARHRLMTLYAKLEDWAMFDLASDHPVIKRAERSRSCFIEALCNQASDPAKADKMARECLITALDGSEELALAHADLLLSRRKATGNIPKQAIGCTVSLDQANDRLRAGVQANFDFVCVPMPWKALTPEEGEYRFTALDNWLEWAARVRMPVVAGPVICFQPDVLPDWLFIWEHDYETVRDVIYEHVERLVTRYKNAVQTWNVVSGLHVNSHFTFNFEQLMDLTRMTTMLIKKVQPAAKVLIEVRQPWGEYFGTNPRSVPPFMYADLLIQGAINFDALSLKLLMGQSMPGQYTRDLMQVSALIEQFGIYGKPLHITLGAPSEPVTQEMIVAHEGKGPVDANSGTWRRPWSPQVQAHWADAVIQIAMSKPYVESITWSDLIDHPLMELPLSGLVSEDFVPKQAFRRLATMRRNLQGMPTPAGGGAGAAVATEKA